LLREALWQAAERGVRVRLLLDDLTTGGLDPVIAALDAHPNIEVRLYNPFVHRGTRLLGFLTDFTRVNRRMHNKSFTADNQARVVGGRNIGNEYFGTGTGVVFADLDVIAVGVAVRDVSKEFDLYWNSPSAYPAGSFVGAGQGGAELMASLFAATHADTDAVAYIDAVRATPLVERILDDGLAFEWTTARLVHDEPAKTLAATTRAQDLLFPELVQTIGRPAKSLDLVSPYFVPGEGGTAALVALARQGVAVRILTNSLSSSDESVVHAGYAPRRLELLRAGVRLYELKPTMDRELREDRSRYGSSSSSGLHAKTFAVDRQKIFIGSFNFDQRSALLNTEMGLVIDSPTLAQRLARVFDAVAPLAAYEVRIAADGRSLEWIEQTKDGEKRHATEPGTTWSQRMKVEMQSVLPIEWLL
jgi:putative cardiolipin synthase